jgi:hypothetical protein
MSILNQLSDETRTAVEKDPRVKYFWFLKLYLQTPLQFQSNSYHKILNEISSKLTKREKTAIQSIVEIHLATINDLNRKF